MGTSCATLFSLNEFMRAAPIEILQRFSTRTIEQFDRNWFCFLFCRLNSFIEDCFYLFVGEETIHVYREPTHLYLISMVYQTMRDEAKRPTHFVWYVRARKNRGVKETNVLTGVRTGWTNVAVFFVEVMLMHGWFRCRRRHIAKVSVQCVR